MTDAPRVDKTYVRDLIGRPDVTIIDVRGESDWQQSNSRIQGAVREDRDKVEAWADKYDRAKTLVLYCA